MLITMITCYKSCCYRSLTENVEHEDEEEIHTVHTSANLARFLLSFVIWLMPQVRQLILCRLSLKCGAGDQSFAAAAERMYKSLHLQQLRKDQRIHGMWPIAMSVEVAAHLCFGHNT